MKPVRLQRQQQVPADLRAEATFASEDEATAPLAAVKLAENGEFSRLLVAVALCPRLVKTPDAFGMTALHWVCTEPKAPPQVVLTVARAHPAAAATRNVAGMLPLHLAIKNGLAVEAIQALLHVYSKAIEVRTPDGKTPLMLAKQRPVASCAVLSMLKVLEAETRTGAPYMTLLPTSQGAEATQDPRQVERIQARLSDNFQTSKSRTREDPFAMISTPHASPPRWALASRCRLCVAKFRYFRQRHHCRNCGASVCGRHSRHQVPLKHLGLDRPQRVCMRCFDDLQNQLNVRALQRVTRTEGAYPNSDNTGHFLNTCAGVQPQLRRRSMCNYSEPTQRYKTLEWEHYTDNASEASARGFVPVSAPNNWCMAASKAVEALQPMTGSMFLSAGPAQLTVLERQRLLREQIGSRIEPKPVRKSRHRRPRLHPSELDRLLHVQRMSEVDSACSSSLHGLEQRMLHLMEVKHELGVDTARMERNLEVIAKKYRDSGYSCPQESEEEDEEAELAATMTFLNAGRRLSSTADLLEDMGAPLDLAATHHELGEKLLSKGDFVRAVSELQRCVDLNDKNSAAWLDLAKALDGAGDDREAAEEAVRRALEVEPASIGALSLLGKLLHLRGDHDDAILVFQQALELQSPYRGRAATHK